LKDVIANFSFIRAADIALAELNEHIDKRSGLDKTYRRNALLAFLELRLSISPLVAPILGKFGFLHGNPPAGELSGSVFALCRHLYQNGHNASTFDDIKLLVENLCVQDQKSFIKACPYFLKHLVGSEIYIGGEYQKDADSIRDRNRGADGTPLPEPGPVSFHPAR
jgi:hypothetical protein